MTPKTYTTPKGKRAAIERARRSVYDAVANLDLDLAYGTTDLAVAIIHVERAVNALKAATYADVVRS